MADDRVATTGELKQLLAEAASDAERLAVLVELRGRVGELTEAETESYLTEAVGLARRTGNNDELGRAGIALSEFYRNTGDIARSLESAGVVREGAAASGNANHQA